MRWHLFGADDPEAVLAAVPPRIRAALPGRIAADRRIDLGTAFRHGFAFLALPGVGGSGTTAKLALREAVPVLVCRDSRRDISNMFPDPPAERDFPALMRALAGWTDRPEARARYLSGQLANINARADLPAKTAEFDAILDRAVAAWRARAASK